MKLSDITVLVPTKNEEKNIHKFLESLPAEIKLIVVDDSEDKTAEIVRKERPENTIIIEKGGNVPTKRQIGADAAKSKWLLFTDADIHFADDFFENLELHNPKSAFYGTKLSDNKYKKHYENFTNWQARFDAMGIPAVTGSNMAIRRDVFSEIGGYDCTMVVNEDTEIGFRLKKKGYKVDYYPDLRVFSHDHRRIEKGLLNKMIHTFLRSALLYFDVMPDDWKKQDWGYWK